MYHPLAWHQHISITTAPTATPRPISYHSDEHVHISTKQKRVFSRSGQRIPGSVRTSSRVCVRGQQRVDWIVIAPYLARTLNISPENYPSAAVIWNQSLTTFRSAKVLGVLTLRGSHCHESCSPFTNHKWAYTQTHARTHLCTHLLSLAFQLNPITVFLRDKPWWNLSINEIYASSFKLVIASRLHSFY